ncbi:hypothetical protein ABC382_01075 [Lysinibacillus sp. 1P01SD]|uniref:DUF7659 family protein n=1 Tax=Lysinibacillus sp. 1P01SD TaxID=3132285 RepID=UPI00399FFE60
MTNLYSVLLNKHREEFNSLPLAFAFSDKQFEEGMGNLGLQPHEVDKVVSIGAGGFMLKSDKHKYVDMLNKHEEDMHSAINNSETGEQFIFDMFNYELANHEYIITFEIDDAIRALGLTVDEIEADERLSNGLKKARQYQRENAIY